MQRRIFAVFAAASISLAAHAQNLIPNGGFESPGLPNAELTRFLTNGSTYMTGWRVVDDGVGERPFYAQRPRSDTVFQNTYGLMLNQGSGVATTFVAESGSFYEFSVWVRPDDCVGCVSPAPMRVAISGNTYLLPLVSGWTRQGVQFFATSATNTLELINPSSSGDYKKFGMDEVSIVKLSGAVLAARLYPGLIIDGVVGAKYQIEAANSLNSINWQTLTNLVLPASPYLYMDVDPKRPNDYPPRQRIYRATRIP